MKAGLGIASAENDEKENRKQDFPGDPVAKTPCSQCRGPGLIPARETRSHMPQGRSNIPPCRNEDLVQPNK